MPTAPQGARITALFKFHYQVPGEATQSAEEVTYCERLETLAEAYDRKVDVGTDWQPLDLGWLDRRATGLGVSFLFIKNCYRPWGGHAPTPSQLEDAGLRIIEIGVEITDSSGVRHVEVLTYLPHEFGTPLIHPEPERLRIRCQKPDGRALVFAVPDEPLD